MYKLLLTSVFFVGKLSGKNKNDQVVKERGVIGWQLKKERRPKS